MKTLSIGSVMALAMTALACGKATPDTSSTLTVTGAIDTKSQALDNASALAVSSDGHTFSAYLQKNGRFTLSLPVGHVYRIIIANSTLNGELRPIGHLVNPTSAGNADVIAVKEAGSMNLGTLRPAGSSSSALHTACNCGGGSGAGEGSGGDDKSDGDKDGDKGGGDKDGDDKGDDYESHQKDQDKDRVCEGSTDVELEADHAPGDKCAKGDGDEEAPKPKAKSCSTKDDNKDGKDDDDSDDGKSRGEGGGGYGSSGGADKGGGDGSCSACAPKPPTSCTCSKQCGSGSSCVASKCVADAPAAPANTPPN